jgi:hypothetical protein
MVAGLGLAACAFLAGCAGVRDRRKIVIEPGTDMARYAVFGVLPFADDGKGGGKTLAKDIIKALEGRGLKTVDPDLMQKEYRKMKGDSFGLTLFSLSTLRAQTKAEVLITGSVTAKSFTLLAQELESGDVLVNVSIERRAGAIPDAEVRETIMKFLFSDASDHGPSALSAEGLGNP